MAKPKLFYRLVLVLAIALNVVALFPPQSASAQVNTNIPTGCPNGPQGPPIDGTICPDGSVLRTDITLPIGCPGGPDGPRTDAVACPARPGRSACTYTPGTKKCLTADGRDVTKGDAQAADPSDTAEEQTCSTGTGLAGALAWVLCPLGQLIADATGFVERNLIVPFLTVSPLQTGNSPVYKLWESMRNIANILFIIAFFAVIFSQATSVGLSNYGIKRLLPRLALVAIGTNLSYFIVAFIIDAFNIFGVGISDLVLGAITGGGGGGGTGANAGNIFTLSTIGVLGVGLAAVITTAGTVLGWLFSLLALAFLIILVAVIVLVVRQMLIILLVIVSPLAFVAWLLPNTEKYFTKWRGMLIQLLMMYPLIVLLFAVGKIVQTLIVGYNFDLAAGEGAAEGTAEGVKVFMGYFAAAVPLVFLPFTFVFTGGAMGKLYGALQNRGRDYGKKGYEKGKERLEPRLNEIRQGLRQSGTKLKEDNKETKGVKGWMRRRRGGVMRGLGGARVEEREAIRANRAAEYEKAKQDWLADQGINNKKFQEKSAGMGGEAGKTRVAARGQAVVDKAEKEALDNEMTLLNRQLKELNIDQKSFAGTHLKAYLENPNMNQTIKVEQRDAAGNVMTHPVTGKPLMTDLRDSSGKVFNFKEHPELIRAGLNSAASQGEIATIEQARIASGAAVTGQSNSQFQQTVDQVVRLNDGKLKEKGAYHLATNFQLAGDRALSVPTAEQLASPTNTPVRQTAEAQQARAAGELFSERLKTIASSGADSVAGMKAGVLGGTSSIIDTLGQRESIDWTAGTVNGAAANEAELRAAETKNAQRAAAFRQLNAIDPADGRTYGSKVRERMTQITSNTNTLNKTEAPGAIQNMERELRRAGF